MLSLENNRFFGDINVYDTTATLYWIYLNNNQLNGTVSWLNISSFWKTSLREFDISDNQLTGSVDWTFLRSMRSLTDFWLNDNHFTGDIDLSGVTHTLNTIYGYNNNFNGTINIDGITSNLEEMFFQNNSAIIGGINFNLIDHDGNKNLSNFPKLFLDEQVYCDINYCTVYDDYVLDTNCWIPQQRNNPPNGYCSGIEQCNDTCTPCAFDTNSSDRNCTVGNPITTLPTYNTTPLTTLTTRIVTSSATSIDTKPAATTYTSTEFKTEEKGSINAELARLINSWQVAGYLCLFGTVVTPIIVTIVAAIYHQDDKYSGCDKPNYLSIFSIFFMFGDFYSDLIFGVILALSGHYLWYFAMFFAIVPHLVCFQLYIEYFRQYLGIMLHQGLDIDIIIACVNSTQ